MKNSFCGALPRLFAVPFVMLVAAKSFAPICTYADPTVGACYRYEGGQLVESVDPITCRMLEVVSGGDPGIVYTECSYYWCDRATACLVTYQKKLRTKKAYENDNSYNCRTKWMVTDVNDTWSLFDCCDCTMGAAPSWPPE